MDESETPVVEVSEPAAPPPVTTLKERFKGFALYHILYSLAFCAFCTLISPLLAACLLSAGAYLLYSIVPLLCIVGMALYFPLGMRKAKRGRWSVPTGKELCLAALLPCLISVPWVLMLPLLLEVLQLYLLISAVLAAPSSLFVLFFSLTVNPTSYLVFDLFALFAAVLPPLLFALGSFCQAKRQNFSPEG